MLETVNKVYFKKSNFDSTEEMYKALFTQELSLVKNGYMCLSYRAPGNYDVFILEFASLDPMFNQGKLIPCWITAQEAGLIAKERIIEYQNDIEYIVKDSLKIDDYDDDDDDFGNNSGGNNVA